MKKIKQTLSNLARRIRWAFRPPSTIVLSERERLSRADIQVILSGMEKSQVVLAVNQLIRNEIAEWLAVASVQSAAGTGAQVHSCGAIDGLTRILGEINYLTDIPPGEDNSE
jgi:hypothetical protein